MYITCPDYVLCERDIVGRLHSFTHQAHLLSILSEAFARGKSAFPVKPHRFNLAPSMTQGGDMMVARKSAGVAVTRLSGRVPGLLGQGWELC